MNTTAQDAALREALEACDVPEQYQHAIIDKFNAISHPPAPEQASGEPDLEKIIDSFITDYELNDGEAFHQPSEFERLLIKDAIMGLLVDEVWDNAWGAHIKSLATPTAEPAVEAVPKELRKMLDEFERAAHRKGELWERCQGKFWPDAESDEFTRLRDVVLPELRAMLSASPAATYAARLKQAEDVLRMAREALEISKGGHLCKSQLDKIDPALAAINQQLGEK